MSSDVTTESIEEEAEDSNDNNDDQIQQQQQQPKKKKKKKKKKKEAIIKFERKLKGAKNLIMLPLRKFQKAYTRRKRPPPVPFPYSEDLGGGSSSSMGCHHLCFVQPRVSDPPRDNDDDLPPLRTNPDAKASSYHDFLRSLLEKNDFYSPECNVHREI